MSYQIQKVGVVGAGTMGAAIAAHVANAGYPVVLLDIVPFKLTPEQEAKGLTLDDPAVRNSIVQAGFDRCRKARPASFMSKEAEALITLGNLEDDLHLLADCDWIVEAIIEKLEPKQALMERLESVRKPGSIVTSNTSGLPIASISEGRSDDFRAHFFGTHFFNPPRYMKLLEIIPTPATDREAVKTIADFCETRLGKGIVYCKDTPNFIGNRMMSIDGAFIGDYAFRNGYTVEEVDAITGPLIGRPKTATFRLQDLVGIDVAAFVGQNLYDLIPNDPYREVLRTSAANPVIEELMKRGWLGNKSGQGFYKKSKDAEGKRVFLVLNPETFEYEMPKKPKFDSVGAVRKIEDLGERLRALFSDKWKDDRAAQLAWAVISHQLVYAAAKVPEIADDILSIDNAMRWGFSYQAGPFEMWDMLGVAETATKMEASGLTVPPWVKDMLAAGHTSFYQYQNGKAVAFYDPTSGDYRPIPADPRKIDVDDLRAAGKELQRNDSASLLDMGDGVLLLEFHAKMNAIDDKMVEMMVAARQKLDEADYVGLVIGNQGENFCVGANIFTIAVAAQQGMFDQIDAAVRALQDALMAFRYSPKPVVVAPFGMALGGGAEIVMAGSRRVAHAESYIGLVEVGVGLIPAGGGVKEMVRRIMNTGMRLSEYENPVNLAERIFQTIGMAKVGTSAAESRELGFLDENDRIVMNRDHLLYEAKQEVLKMAAEGYVAPAPEKVFAAGRDTLAALNVGVWMMQQGNYLSEHDALIGKHLARVICGGNLTVPQWVDEQHFLDLEREAFVELTKTEKTVARIWHMLQTGKPLRN
ncbi:MAG: 3-hydroxyacyl-CoA dehydrogenase/enoyl-CoA hydratase family protein [Caldilineae bacterium]|nr:MAG: 3-hydroxyacyl-CoA dehydrogenase/enoyl-CoA hydratase family protein [Caldilineae bacterium]